MRAAQPLELELGLVGTAGSATANGEDNDEENLVLMPLQLRRVGVLCFFGFAHTRHLSKSDLS